MRAVGFLRGTSAGVAVRAVGVVMAVTLAGCSGAGPTGSPGAGTPSAIAVPDGFPLGTWTVTITEDDLRAAGLTDPAGIRENSGTFTRTMAADGTWTMVQTAPNPVRWPVFRGTFRPTSDDTWVETTIFPAEYAGDVVTFRWVLEGDALNLRVVDPPDAILPILTETHPWRRS